MIPERPYLPFSGHRKRCRL